ncbi:hypothetical protein [Gemmobacter lanyuensis]|uniref:hypothetical protein n=1 Tax=Gemmobacter lanyuensis TaxID=1054497 RepID=UPI0016772557|nr:hypothetical protein [Gemmobacter lanyuensis]
MELVESGSGRLLRKSWVLGVQTVSILRARDEDGRPQIRAIQVDGAELSGRGCWAFACREGFRDNEPGCRSADEAMARFFATIYPAADPAADIEPLGNQVLGGMVSPSDASSEGRV